MRAVQGSSSLSSMFPTPGVRTVPQKGWGRLVGPCASGLWEAPALLLPWFQETGAGIRELLTEEREGNR